MSAPIPRMTGPPRAHPLDVHRPPEVIPILRPAEPAALPCRLPGRSTAALGAVLLTPAVAHIHREIIAAAQALALYLIRHGSLARGSIFTDEERAAVAAAGITTGGKKIETNKTI